MAMSICESFQSTALAGLGIRPPHWAVPQFSKPPDSSWAYLSSELRKAPLPSAVARERALPRPKSVTQIRPHGFAAIFETGSK